MSLWTSPLAPGLTELLGVLDDGNIHALAITAAANRLLPENRKEAVEIILRYTESLDRLFSYKRMTSQVLTKYLHKKEHPMRAGLTKTELIAKVREQLEKSVKKETSSQALMRNSVTEQHIWPNRTNGTLTPAPTLPPPSTVTPAPTVTSSPTLTRAPMLMAPPGLAATPGSPHIAEPPQQWSASPSVHVNLATNASRTSLQLSVNAASSDVSVGVQQWSAGSDGSGGGSGGGGGDMSKVFYREFCQWFYTMVNRLQPEAVQLQGDTLTADVFVVNSSVDVFLHAGNQVVEKHATGHLEAFTTLRDTLVQCGTIFSPNIESGVCCDMSSFGMVRLQCCGTLHRQQSMVGLFEQECGVVRCSDGRWKVMTLKLNLRQM